MNPASMLFGAGVALRNSLYDRQWLRAKRLARPVVSVGNISVGGSGKTPFIIALGRLLVEGGIKFDVLSRGYGRDSGAVRVVDPAGPPREYGDEPLLIARNLGVPVIVGADRHAAGLLAEQSFASALHLLDDGFQHRRLHRDFDIVMLPASDLQDTLLPFGRLREPLSSLRRADAVAAAPDTKVPEWIRSTWRLRREMLLDDARGFTRAVAFCGLARPHQFFEGLAALQKSGTDVAETAAFRDHHRYGEADVARLLSARKKAGADGFLTTEKDEINLGGLAARLQPLKVVKMRLTLEDARSALQQMLTVVQPRTGCRF